jgi:hypothetical protein
LCHFIALSALDRANIIHLLSDATTKRHVGVFHINAKIEVKELDGTVMQDIPLKFKVPYFSSLLTYYASLPFQTFSYHYHLLHAYILLKITRNGTGECEAEAVMEALDTNYAGLKVMLHSAENRFLHCVSSSTDNASAAVSVSNILREKKHRIFDDLETLYGKDHDKLKGVVRELHVLTCTNHTHNLAGEAWWNPWKDCISEAIRRQNSARLIAGIWQLRKRHRHYHAGVPLRGMRYVEVFLGKQYKNYYAAVEEIRNKLTSFVPVGGVTDQQYGSEVTGLYNFSNAVHCCSKVFAEGGEGFENYLNESKDFKVSLHSTPFCPLRISLTNSFIHEIGIQIRKQGKARSQ